MSLKCFVAGYTGGAGASIVTALAQCSEYTAVTLFGRRAIELPSNDPNYTKFTQTSVDFDNLVTKHVEDLKGFNVGFCALGVPSGTPNYFKITHDYVVDMARLAKDGGCTQFHVITGQSTNLDSRFEWARIKAQMEQSVIGLGYDRVSIYRPAYIIVENRTNHHVLQDKILRCVIGGLDRWRKISVEADVLGRVIVKNALRDINEKYEILENKDIIKLGKELN